MATVAADEMIEAMAREIVAAQGMDPDERDSISGLPIWQMLGTGPARAALAAILPVMREDIAAVVMAAPIGGRTRRVRARFDQIAKEIEG